MAILAQHGTSLLVGEQNKIHGSSVTFTNYIVESATDGTREIDSEDIMNEDGLWVTRLVFRREKTVQLNLIAKAAATPLTDFPAGAMCTVTGLTTYFVDSCEVAKSKSAQRVSVKLIQLGCTN